MIAIEVDDVKVAHPIIVILRWLDHLCAAFAKFGENTVDIPHEHVNSAVARYLLGFIRCEQVQSDFVTAQASIERRLSVLKIDFEAQRVAVMLDALGYVPDDKLGRGTYQHRTFLSHPGLPAIHYPHNKHGGP